MEKNLGILNCGGHQPQITMVVNKIVKVMEIFVLDLKLLQVRTYKMLTHHMLSFTPS